MYIYMRGRFVMIVEDEIVFLTRGSAVKRGFHRAERRFDAYTTTNSSPSGLAQDIHENTTAGLPHRYT